LIQDKFYAASAVKNITSKMVDGLLLVIKKFIATRLGEAA